MSPFDDDEFATVSGGRGNRAVTRDTTIGGGRENFAFHHASTVSGGRDNTANGETSIVAGGRNNTASDQWAAVGGGRNNNANGRSSVVSGGFNNETRGTESTVSGGISNIASGDRSIVPGGFNNNARGDHSLAAGRGANANHDGSFVWGDNSFLTVGSRGVNSFVVQAGGGTTIYSASNRSSGVELDAGSGSWSSVSSRRMKTNIMPVDPGAVLTGVRSLPIGTWEYRSQAGVSHMGPMAEDFAAVFGLCPAQDRITTVDADGVALAAIQGLADHVDDAIGRLTDRVTALELENATLKTQLRTLIKTVPVTEVSISDSVAG